MSKNIVLCVRSAVQKRAAALGIGMIAGAAMLVTASATSAAPPRPWRSPLISVGYDSIGTLGVRVTRVACVDSPGELGTVTIIYATPDLASRTVTLSQDHYDGVDGWQIGLELIQSCRRSTHLPPYAICITRSRRIPWSPRRWLNRKLQPCRTPLFRAGSFLSPSLDCRRTLRSHRIGKVVDCRSRVADT